MNNACYIGAGVDLIPVIIYQNIKEFIYIDSQPFSEHGTASYNEITNEYISYNKKEDRHENALSRPTFMSRLFMIMSQIHFKLIESNDNFWLFKNNDRTVKYYYSCSFPEYIDDNIINDIKKCNTIILCGYDPNKIVFDYLQKPTYLIGNNHTVYKQIEYEDNDVSLIKYLLDNPDKIIKYYMFKEKSNYEYWYDETQIPSLINDYDIIEYHNLQNMQDNIL